MPKAGRIWNHFTKLGHVEGTSQKRARCNYCNYELHDAAKRCEKHLETCKKADLHIIRSYFGPNFQRRNRGQWSTRRSVTVQSSVQNPSIDSSTSALSDASASPMIIDSSMVSSVGSNLRIGEKFT